MKKLLLHSLVISFALAGLNANAVNGQTMLEQYNALKEAKRVAQEAYNTAQALPANDGNKQTAITTAETNKKAAEKAYNDFVNPDRIKKEYNNAKREEIKARNTREYIVSILPKYLYNADHYAVLNDGLVDIEAELQAKQQELQGLKDVADHVAKHQALLANDVAKHAYQTQVKTALDRVAANNAVYNAIAQADKDLLVKYGITDDATLAQARLDSAPNALPAINGKTAAEVAAGAKLIAEWQDAFNKAHDNAYQQNIDNVEQKIEALQAEQNVLRAYVDEGTERAPLFENDGQTRQKDQNGEVLHGKSVEDCAKERKNLLINKKNAASRAIKGAQEKEKQIEDLAKELRISLDGAPVASYSFKDAAMFIVHCNHPVMALSMTTAYWLLGQNKIETTAYISNEVLKKRLAKAILGGFGAASLNSMFKYFGTASMQNIVCNEGLVLAANYVAVDMATRYAYDKFVAKADAQDATVDDTDEEDDEEISVFTQDNAKQFGAFLGNTGLAWVLYKGEALLKSKITG